MRGLVAQGLCLTRGGYPILQSVSVAAQRGEFIAVLGPNGAGKSSLLSVLAGLCRPDQGEVRLDGLPLRQIPPRTLARQRAFLPQSPRCDWPLPVERLIALGLTPSLPAFGDFSAQDAARIEAALVVCDLVSHRGQSATTLSGGELARAMLARALVGDPDLLIIDEPLSGLDPRHALDAAQRLGRLAREDGKLVIAAVHDLNLALRHATRIWALREGRLLADGPPATTLTAALLREVYDVSGCVSGEGPQAYVDYA
jgi:iron complex transport system ATP-binding protein